MRRHLKRSPRFRAPTGEQPCTSPSVKKQSLQLLAVISTEDVKGERILNEVHLDE